MKCPLSMRPEFRELREGVALGACQCLLITLHDLLILRDPKFFTEQVQIVIVPWEWCNALKMHSSGGLL
jgi:hypothetical protein